MKKMFLVVLAFLSVNGLANELRSQCENAYYANAGGVTTLHHYQLIVNWGKLSDAQLVQLEDLIYADETPLTIVSEKNWKTLAGKSMSTFILKENSNFNKRDYVSLIQKLKGFSAIMLGCF